MDYGSRAGMQVSILGMAGRDTAHAVIRFAHTRDNAIAYCRDSLGNVTEQCVQSALEDEKGLGTLSPATVTAESSPAFSAAITASWGEIRNRAISPATST